MKRKGLAFFLVLPIVIAFGFFSNQIMSESITANANTVFAYGYTDNLEEELSEQGYVVKFTYVDVLRHYYNDIVDFARSFNLPLDLMCFDEFYEEFYAQERSLSQYTQYIKDYIAELALGNQPVSQTANALIAPMSVCVGCVAPWYKTGLDLPYRPSYGKSFGGAFLLNVVMAGDIIYEDKGFSGATGHIALVEGLFWSNNQNMVFIRVLESICEGVTRGVFDDDRIASRQGKVLWVPSATASQRVAAINFTIAQLGKPWRLQLNKPTSSDAWQASTLVWAAYKNQGIDIEDKSLFSGIGITAKDILNAKTTSVILQIK